MSCRSDCPQGDCANCDGLPRPARRVSRCVPSDCPQASACAHAAAAPSPDHHDFDASRCKTSDGWCPMFIDLRGLALVTFA